MLGLELDPSKTYAWSTDASQRRFLKSLDFQVLGHVRELGGFLPSGGSVRKAELIKRCRNLNTDWKTLLRSKTPTHFKLAVLLGKFWANGLHGAAGVLIADTHITQLRSAVTRAIGINSAGSSPLLRLSLCADLTTDPGFFQVWSTLALFCRMLRKHPELCLQ